MQIAVFGNVSRIEAYSHGAKLGEFRTVQGAKCALTRAHKAWISAMNSDALAYRNSI